MKKFLSLILAALLALSATAALAEITIAVPNDPTNEGRALLLLQANGIITLDPEAGVTATAADIIDNPLGIEFYEVEAAMVPMIMVDVDYAIINNNYALDFGLNPVADSLLIESAESPYANVLCVNAGNENTPAAKALAAALNSQKVAEYITNTYGGAAVSVVAEPTDGYDPTVDYAALAGTVIVVGASPVPHAEILEIAKEILAAKGVELEIMVFSDYVMPNLAVDAGEIFANYFAHIPYQENFNAENGTNIVVVSAIHVEPMGLYGGQQADLSLLGLPAAE
jgi:D-methionine transport system substrate-binding protein